MANKPKVQDRDRRAKIEAMRKAEQAKERRKSMIFVIVAIVVGVGLVAAVAIPSYVKSKNDPAKKSMSDFGVSLASASCSAGADHQGHEHPGRCAQHVQDGTIEKYKTVPPSYGPHWATPDLPVAGVLHGARPARRWSGWCTTSSTATRSSGTTRRSRATHLQELKDLAVSARKQQAGRARHEVHRLGVGRRLREVPVRQAHRRCRTGARRTATSSSAARSAARPWTSS